MQSHARHSLAFHPGQVLAGTRSHCPYCAFQCGLTLVEDKGRFMAVPDPTFPVNQGQMCIKGFTAGELLTHPERLLVPQKRNEQDVLEPISWDQALDEIAVKILSIREAYGADAVGCFGSGSLTNEKAYLLGKFARVALRTSAIDYNGRYCMSSAAAGQNRAFGIDRGMPFPVADIEHARTVMLWGSNLADTLPPILQYFEVQRARGGRLIVVDPRVTPTARRANLHLQNVPGSDLILANGLLYLAIEMGVTDNTYIDARTTGFDLVRASVSRYTPDVVERVAGVPLVQMRQAVEWMAQDSAMLLSGRGPEQQSKGVDSVLAFTNFMLALGKVGRPYSGYGTLTGQGNGQGGREHGQKADQLPGYRLIENEQHRREIAKIWNVSPSAIPRKGRSAVEMLNTLGTETKALLVFGSNVVVATPDSDKVERGLRDLDLLVVADVFENETARHADYVLPVFQWAEEEGTLTNLEGRVIHRRPMSLPPEGVRSDLFIFTELAARLGEFERFNYGSVRDVFSEFTRATAGGLADYSGITYERLDANDGIHWPCPDLSHPGTPRLFADRFAHADGRARFVPVEHRPTGESPDREYPFFLTTGRYKEQYNSGAQTRRVGQLLSSKPIPLVEIHPHTAARLNISDNETVRLATRRGVADFQAVLTSDIRLDTVFVPFHYGGRQAINRLTNPALDPTSRMPEYKVCAVHISPITSK